MGVTTIRTKDNRTYELKNGIWYLIHEEDFVSQSDLHARLAIALFEMLEELLRSRPLARVFFDIFIHWDRTDGELCVAPDLVVFPRAEPGERNSIYLWEEASRPAFVLEVASPTSRDNDLDRKVRLYQDELAVPEYFICDPLGDRQTVKGYRRVSGRYRQILPNEDDRVWSDELRAWFGPDAGGQIQVWDASGQQMSRHAAAVARAEAEQLRADAAEREREAERVRVEAALERAEAAEAQVRALQQALQALNAPRPEEPPN